MIWHKCTNAGCSRAGWCKRISYTSGDDTYRDFECGDYNGWPHYVRNKAREIYERDYNATEEFNQTEYEDNNRESGVREDDNADSGIRASSAEGYTTEADWFLQLLRGCIGRGSDPSFVSIDSEGTVNVYQGSDVLQNPTRDGVPLTGSVNPESFIGERFTEFLESCRDADNSTQNDIF